MNIRHNSCRRTDGNFTVDWPVGHVSATYEPLSLPSDARVTVSLHGQGHLLGSRDNQTYAVAVDTAGKIIRGPIGAAHVAPRYRFLKPDQLTGKIELDVRPE